jgi:O-antigen/teichoic acid export membrane protein
MRNFFKDKNAQSTAASVISAGLGMINFAFLTRSVNKEILGEWVFFLAILGLLEMARTGFLGNAFQKLYFDKKSESHKNTVIGSTWKLAAVTNAVVLVSSFLLYKLGSLTHPSFSYLHFFWWIPAALIAGQISNVAVWLLSAREKYITVLWILSGIQVVFAFGIYLIAVHILNPDDLIYIFIASQILPGLAITGLGYSGISNWNKGNRKTMKSLFNFGKFTFGTSLGTSLLKSSDTLLLMPFLGPAAVAFYGVPERVIRIIEVPLQGFIAAYFPPMAQANRLEGNAALRNLLLRSMGYLFWLLLFPLALVWIFTPELIKLIAGTGFTDSQEVFKIFILYIILIPFDRLNGMALDILNQPKYNLRKVILMVLVNILGDLIVLLNGEGITGVAYVSIATYFTGILAGFWYLRAFVHVSIIDIFKLGWMQLLKKSRLINLTSLSKKH